ESSINETAHGNYYVYFDWGISDPVTVHYHMDGNATTGIDYEALSGEVVLTRDANVPLDTFLSAGGKDAILTLEPGPGYKVGSPSSANIDIVAPTLTVYPPFPPSVDEGDTAYYAVDLSFALSQDLPIGYGMSGNAVSGTDYTPLSDNAVIPAGFLGL